MRSFLRRDILSICREGPEAELNSTRTSQPAIFLHSMAVLEVLGRAWGAAGPFARPPYGARPREGGGVGLAADGAILAAAGLSLGEFSALVFALSIDFEDAVRIVALRGAFMQEAVPLGEGAIAAILGLDAAAVREACEAAADGQVVAPANFNGPGQVRLAALRRAQSRRCS